MSCRKPQNVVCHKFCPHTKYLKACKYYFKNKSIASLRVEYLFATLHAKVSVEYSKKFLLRLRLRLQKSQKSFSASSRYGYYWEFIWNWWSHFKQNWRLFNICNHDIVVGLAITNWFVNIINKATLHRVYQFYR